MYSWNLVLYVYQKQVLLWEVGIFKTELVEKSFFIKVALAKDYLLWSKDTIYTKLALIPWIDGNLGHTLSVLT